jgi:streptogramin lyase
VPATPVQSPAACIYPGRKLSVRLGGKPEDVAVGLGSVWASDENSATVTKIDPTHCRPTSVFSHFGASGFTEATAIAVGDRFVWVADLGDGVRVRIDPAYRATETINVPPGPNRIALGEGGVWVTDENARQVVQIDTKSADILGRSKVGSMPRGIAIGYGDVWVADTGIWHCDTYRCQGRQTDRRCHRRREDPRRHRDRVRPRLSGERRLGYGDDDRPLTVTGRGSWLTHGVNGLKHTAKTG